MLRLLIKSLVTMNGAPITTSSTHEIPKGEQKSLLDALKRIFGTSIVSNHFIVPKTNVQILALLLGSLKAPNHAMVHQVAAHLHINDFFVRARLTAIRELRDTG